MHPTIKQAATNLSELIPVKWDRFTMIDGYYNIYGWIDRPDGQRDFVLLQLWLSGVELKGGFVTSSARYSKTICAYFFGEEFPHVDCIKFETDTVPTEAEGAE